MDTGRTETLLGTLPIALGTGASAAARRPLGLAGVGVFLVSQLFALYITPVLYLYMESAQKYLAEHPIWRVFFWRRGRYGVPSATPATHSSSADKSLCS